MATDPPLTAQIPWARSGDRGASEDLYAALHDELRQLAHEARTPSAVMG